MKTKKEKKGFFERLMERKKAEKSSCCCNFQIEEIPDREENSEKSEQKKN